MSSDRDTENEKVNEKAMIDSLFVRKTRTDRQTDREEHRGRQRQTEKRRGRRIRERRN